MTTKEQSQRTALLVSLFKGSLLFLHFWQQESPKRHLSQSLATIFSPLFLEVTANLANQLQICFNPSMTENKAVTVTGLHLVLSISVYI